MNYKLLFPTYRNRYLFVKENLENETGKSKFGSVLNLGTGEGDYDPMIAAKCTKLIACDINENDIAFAKSLNAGLDNLTYRMEDALQLSFLDNSFDLIISVDVMEHVGHPELMTAEIGRVLKPGGLAFISFPQVHFPWTYDPINRFFGKKTISQGAYAFGHDYLIDGELFKTWAQKNGLQVIREKNLSGYLVSFLEMYWTGMIQRIFKENATNLSSDKQDKGKLRPTLAEPFLIKLTDMIIWLDSKFFSHKKYAVGKGFVLQKV